LGPTIPAFERYNSVTIVRTASAAGAMSSWQSRKNPLSPSTSRRTSLTAGPYPGFPAIARMKAAGRYERILAVTASRTSGPGSPTTRNKNRMFG
jgi:hypothetical protein